MSKRIHALKWDEMDRYMIFRFLQSYIRLNYPTIFHRRWYSYALHYVYFFLFLIVFCNVGWSLNEFLCKLHCIKERYMNNIAAIIS